MKTKHILTGIIACGMLMPSITSCDNYLDTEKYFYDQTSLDSVFQRKSLLMKYLNGASAYCPNVDQLWTNAYYPFSFTSDEAFCSWNDDRHAGIKYALGELDRYTGYFNNWFNYYKGIRKANMILERLHECPDITETERRDITGQCHFLRAYLTMCLVQQYGPVPILDHSIPSNADVASMSFERNTYEECVNFITAEFDLAAQMLDSGRPSMETFRVPTSKAATALASRMLLEAASPWFNGNKYYGNFKRSTDNTLYFPVTYDKTKWGKAAAMAKRCIDMTSEAELLYTVPKDRNTPEFPDNVSKEQYPNGVGGIDPYHSYSDIFTGEESALNIPEVIWARNETNDLTWIAFPAVMGGGNGLCVSQQLVDAYRMQNGKDINDEGSGYPGADERWKPIGNGKSFSGYQLLSNAAKMYDNREMRFYASISFNHVFFEASSYTGSEANNKNLEATYYLDGTAAAWSDYPYDKTFSGYNMMKYTHPSDAPKGTRRSKYFPIIRYGEVLLNYVEAMNEMEEPYTDEKHQVTVSRDVTEMVKYFNMIRYRAGLPGISEADASDKGTMRELIHRERQVELALEGNRFYDLRRWGQLQSTLSSPFVVMNVNAKSSQREKFHTPTIATYRYSIYNVNNKMCLFPIPQSILDKNAKLDENPGW